MDVFLTGTGPAGGFPTPGCPCAPCATAALSTFPAPSSPTGSAPAGARRPAELLLRAGTGPGWRLDVDGVVHEPGDRSHRLSPGDRLELPGFDVQALAPPDHPDRPALLVRIADRAPLLWAPQCGPFESATLDSLDGVGLGIAILGPVPENAPTDPQDDRPPLVDSAFGLARLRSIDAITARTTCLMVGAGHRQPNADWLAACLASWRVRIPPDDTLLPAGAPSADSNDAFIRGRTLVLGGSASGKSALAEHLLAAEPQVLYIATGPVVDLRSRPDSEWAERVSRHRERRPAWWQTEETDEVVTLLTKAEQPVLLDSIGTWLTGVLDRSGAWQDKEGWRRRLAAETDALVRVWRARQTPLVAVTDEVGWGVVPITAAGRLFRDELGRLNRRLANESEQVLVVVAGRVLTGGVPAEIPARP